MTEQHTLYSVGPSTAARFDFWMVGLTPLIVHAWSAKAKNEMLAKQTKTAKTGREARNPEQDFLDSLYILDREEDGTPIFGFPAMGVKNAIISVAHKNKGIAKTEAMSALFLDAQMARGVTAKRGAINDLPLVRIWAPPPMMREDAVRLGDIKRTASLAYRGMFTPWAIHVSGSLNTKVLSMENLTFLIREAGLSAGIGEWRNERKGMFGAFRLATPDEAEAWEAHTKGAPLPGSLQQAAE